MFQKLWRPRLTRYEEGCIRLAEVSLDLPLVAADGSHGVPDPRVRDAVRVPGKTLREWVVDVLRENVLAGVVLADALDLTWRRLSSDLGEGYSRFPDAQDKREFTMAAGEYWVEFRVPAGWDFVLNGDSHPEGYTGVAMVKRCHLSENLSQPHHGYGRLLGAPGCEGDVGFDIPCGYFRQYRIEGDRLVSDAPPRSDGVQ